ncbi:MAG: BtpA/SgcQ family protein [Epulopiscium sp.]|nr:BtpA/SgcQ family protein [Candidatus Epulonipiscium sp.]
MTKFQEVFKDEKVILGMVHLPPLPGSAGFDGDMEKVYASALADAKALEEGGVTALVVENAGDAPFGKELSLSQSTALAAVASYVKAHVNIPIGIVATFCDYKAAIACAKAARADFVRLAVFVDTVACFAGILEPCCAQAMKYRKAIQAEELIIFADIQVKYTHMTIPSITLEESAQVAEVSGADAIIVTGTHTGVETPMESLERVKAVVGCPVIIGSGANESNIKKQMKVADGAIVGSSLKMEDKITNPVDVNKVKKLIESM